MRFICGLYSFIGWFGKFIPQLLFRMLVAWHFWDSGLAKFHKEVTSIPEQKISPFSLVGDELSLSFIMWLELAAAVLIFIGFSVRIAAAALLVLLSATFMSYMPLEFDSLLSLWSNIDTQIPAFKYQFALFLILISLALSGAGGLSFDGLLRFSSCPRKRSFASKEMKSAKQAEREAKIAEKEAKIAEKEAFQAEKDAQEAKVEARKATEKATEFEEKANQLEAKLARVEQKLDQAEEQSDS